jgi:hypothetical protein
MTTKISLLTHGWPGECWRVVSGGLSVITFVLLLSLFIYGKYHAHYAYPRTTCNSSYYFLIHIFVNILIRVIKKKPNELFLWKKWRSLVPILLLPAIHSILHVQGRQLCNSSAYISNGHETPEEKKLESQDAVIRTMPKY